MRVVDRLLEAGDEEVADFVKRNQFIRMSRFEPVDFQHYGNTDQFYKGGTWYNPVTKEIFHFDGVENIPDWPKERDVCLADLTLEQCIELGGLPRGELKERRRHEMTRAVLYRKRLCMALPVYCFKIDVFPHWLDASDVMGFCNLSDEEWDAMLVLDQVLAASFYYGWSSIVGAHYATKPQMERFLGIKFDA